MFLEIITSAWTGVVIVLAALILTFRYVCKAEDRLFDMLSRTIAVNNELGKRLADIEERLEAAEANAECARNLAHSAECTAANFEGAIDGTAAAMKENYLKLKEKLENISAQLEKIDFENVNKAIKAQADFDEGFANILNYGLNGRKKE